MAGVIRPWAGSSMRSSAVGIGSRRAEIGTSYCDRGKRRMNLKLMSDTRVPFRQSEHRLVRRLGNEPHLVAADRIERAA